MHEKVTKEGLSDRAGGSRWIAGAIVMRIEKDVFINAETGMLICVAQSFPTYSSPTHHLHHQTHLNPSNNYWYKADPLLLNEALVLLVRLVPVAILLLRPELL
jgi:hypothetical protein